MVSNYTVTIHIYHFIGCKPSCSTDLRAYICFLTPEELQAVSEHIIVNDCGYLGDVWSLLYHY